MTVFSAFFLAAMLAGLAAFQGPINTQLAARTGTVAANVFSNVVGTAALLVVMAIWEPSAFQLQYWKSRFQLGMPPPQLWVGGLLGSLFMLTMVFAVSRVGVSGWVIAALVGQLTAGIIVDSIGLFGLTKHTVGWQQIVGMAVVFLGALLVLSGKPSP